MNPPERCAGCGGDNIVLFVEDGHRRRCTRCGAEQPPLPCEPGCLEPAGHLGAPRSCITGPLPSVEETKAMDRTARRTNFARVCRVEAAGDGLAKRLQEALDSVAVARFPGTKWVQDASRSLALWKLERGDDDHG